MKKIQKCLIAILVLSMVMGMLAACGEDSTTGTTNGTTSGATNEPTGTTQTPETTAPAVEDTYSFSVILEDSQLPVDGVKISLSNGDVTLDPVTTNAVGIAKYKLGSNGYGEYTVQIDESTVPEGYHVSDTAYTTNATDKEYTIVLEKDVCEHVYKDEVCELCGAQKTYPFTVHLQYGAYVKDESVRKQPVAGVQILISTDSQQVATGVTDENGDFKFEAPKYTADDGYSGYNITIVDGTPKGYYFQDGLLFMAKEDTVSIECFTKVNNGTYTAFNPLKLYLDGKTATASGKVNMTEMWEDDDDTAHDDSLYFFSVTPNDPSHVGHYKVTVTGIPEGVTVKLGHYASSAVTVNHDPQKSVTATGEDLVLEFIMEERYMRESTTEQAWTYNNSWMFGLYVEGETNYPLELQVTVERDRDLIPGTDYTVTNRNEQQRTEGAKDMSEIVGDVTDKTLNTFDGTTAADVTLVLGDDGYYHIGSADGAILLINVKNGNPFFGDDEDESTVSFVNVNAVSGVQNLMYSHWEEDHYEVEYFHKLFVTYDENNEISYAGTYTELCDANGYYAVNEQLYYFLRNWTEQRVDDTQKQGLDAEHAFLLACGYYA